MSAALTLRTDVRLHRMRAEGDALDAETGALPWDPGVTFRELVELSRRYAAPSPEALDVGCLRAVGACSCEACKALAADTRAIRGVVADTLRDLGANAAAQLLVRRGILDTDAVAAVKAACARVSEGEGRVLVFAWVDDLAAGRHDRIDRSHAVWSRAPGRGHYHGCVACATAAFDTGADRCDGCATDRGEVTP